MDNWLKGKKAIIIGEREGVQGPSIAKCLEAAVEIWLKSSSMRERFSSGEKRRWFLMTRSFLPIGGPRSCHHSNIFCPVFGMHSNSI
jgi:hypothetical protein